MDDILEQIKRQSTLSVEEESNNEFSNIKEQFVIADNVEYPDPEYLIRIGDVPTLPKGNLVSLSAKWKNGKTFFCDILAGIFLGSRIYANCENLIKQGKVQFFDTEQAVSDTARIRKTIKAITPAERHGDLEVFCLRNAGIDNDEHDDEISRYEFIKRSLEHDHPDLVIVDGIADLIYNYNDVIESQTMVNNLAALANEFNCCIVVVMHQNKGKQDKSMKGHIGTMLYQKSSDVFQIEKVANLFVVTHSVSRHRQCEELIFKLDEQAIPMDATADRQLQVEIEHQQEVSEAREYVLDCFDEGQTEIKRKELVNRLMKKFGYKATACYKIIDKSIKMGAIRKLNRFTIELVQQ